MRELCVVTVSNSPSLILSESTLISILMSLTQLSSWSPTTSTLLILVDNSHNSSNLDLSLTQLTTSFLKHIFHLVFTTSYCPVTLPHWPLLLVFFAGFSISFQPLSVGVLQGMLSPPTSSLPTHSSRRQHLVIQL